MDCIFSAWQGMLMARTFVAWGGIAALLLAAGLSGCAVQLQNRQAAQQLAEQARPAGSVYAGWRVFQDKCARCHGVAATGSPGAPDLLPRLREMGSRQFVGLVLKRYDWQLPPDQAAEAQLEAVLQRQAGGLSMPAWQGEPVVSAHIVDLYAYLGARAQGTQGPGRPQP